MNERRFQFELVSLALVKAPQRSAQRGEGRRSRVGLSELSSLFSACARDREEEEARREMLERAAGSLRGLTVDRFTLQSNLHQM